MTVKELKNVLNKGIYFGVRFNIMKLYTDSEGTTCCLDVNYIDEEFFFLDHKYDNEIVDHFDVFALANKKADIDIWLK